MAGSPQNRYMALYSITRMGWKVIIDDRLTEDAPRTWVDEVLSWNPCNRFPTKPPVPSSEVFFMRLQGAMIMHSAMFRALQRDIERGKLHE